MPLEHYQAATDKSSSLAASHVVVVASTNRVDAIDPALRRSCRFDAEVEVTTPSEEERFQIVSILMRPGRFDLVLYVPPPDQEAGYVVLQVHTRKMQMSDYVNLRHIAEYTELFTGTELEGLCREVGMVVLREDISARVVCNRHFQIVLQELKPGLSIKDIDSYSSFTKNPTFTSCQSEVSSQETTEGTTKNATVLTTLVVVGVSIVLSACLKYGWALTDQVSRDYVCT